MIQDGTVSVCDACGKTAFTPHSFKGALPLCRVKLTFFNGIAMENPELHLCEGCNARFVGRLVSLIETSTAKADSIDGPVDMMIFERTEDEKHEAE